MEHDARLLKAIHNAGFIGPKGLPEHDARLLKAIHNGKLVIVLFQNTFL